MRFALLNPPWRFERSIYFGCPSPHLPLEFGYAKALLESAGHDVLMIDAFLGGLDYDEMRRQLRAFQPDASVLTTAPSYLFWRCAPPELATPLRLLDAMRDELGELIVIGPHGSTTPAATLRKLCANVVIIGEPEELLPRLNTNWGEVPSLCFEREGKVQQTGAPHQSNMTDLPALSWESSLVSRHRHHHHRFDRDPVGPGAEVESSRGCPYSCTFCAKENFRNKYRKRPLNTILTEIDRLLSQGVEYIYFVDEIFLPNEPLLKSLAERDLKIGVQTRIDLWNEASIELLAKAGCVSIEAGVESITEEGRAYLDKKCRLSTDQLTQRLAFAKRLVPFVQANLISTPTDSEEDVEIWRQSILRHGVWANKPVPLFPYPGSPEYSRRWGAPDDLAWERAHEYYLGIGEGFSDIQEQNPLPLVQLELSSHERP
jgi:B12-binding domain/radical SAM domain protein of rhizo-twelve system